MRNIGPSGGAAIASGKGEVAIQGDGSENVEILETPKEWRPITDVSVGNVFIAKLFEWMKITTEQFLIKKREEGLSRSPLCLVSSSSCSDGRRFLSFVDRPIESFSFGSSLWVTGEVHSFYQWLNLQEILYFYSASFKKKVELSRLQELERLDFALDNWNLLSWNSNWDFSPHLRSFHSYL